MDQVTRQSAFIDPEIYRRALLEDCLPFWFPRCIDEVHGGFLHFLDRNGNVFDTDKSVWAQGRMAWMLLTLYYTVEKRPEWLAWAESGLRFLDAHCFDSDGRMFFHVTREGRPIRKRRYAYSEAFAAIAFAAHARATGKDSSAHRARELLKQFTRWNFTPGLMSPKFTDTRPLIGIGPRMIALVTTQELRTNLGDDPLFESWIDRNLGEIRSLFVKPELKCVMESVAPDGSVVHHTDGSTLNPGHAIEAAWFILHEARHRKDDSLSRLGCDMLDWMWQRGWDSQHGGLLYFTDLSNKPPQEYWHDMKFWWPHCEAIIATALAGKLSGEARFFECQRQVHDWSFQHFADSECGEWFGYLHRDGSLSTTTKGNLWKSFFHLPRMLWYCGWSVPEKPQTAP